MLDFVNSIFEPNHSPNLNIFCIILTFKYFERLQFLENIFGLILFSYGPNYTPINYSGWGEGAYNGDLSRKGAIFLGDSDR